MKLHLPKMLLTAVLAACSSAYAFGPQVVVDGETVDVSYTTVETATNSAQAPTVDTYYSNVTGAFNITGADGVDVKLSPATPNSDIEYALGTITASSTWIAGGRFSIAGDELSNAGTLYVNGGALQFKDATTLTQQVIIGTSTYTPTTGGWDDAKFDNIKNAALIVGYWEKTGKTVTLAGGLDVAEPAKIGMQSGYNLDLTGTLTGSSALNIAACAANKGSASVVTLSGSAKDYSGAVTLTGIENYGNF